MHVDQDDVHLVKNGLDSRAKIRNNKTLDFRISGDLNPLHPHAGQLGGCTKEGGCGESGQIDDTV